MAEGKGYQKVEVTIKGEQNNGSFEEARTEASKRGSKRGCSQEDIELLEVPAFAIGEEKRAPSSNARENGHPVHKKESLLETVDWERDDFEKIKARVTAKTLVIDENPLLLAIKVTEKLHERVAKKEPNSDDFIELANQVEEFTLRFLDPLKHVKAFRENFSSNPETDLLLETAIKLKQKKFFDHPIMIDLMNERWYGYDGEDVKDYSPVWWWLLNVWCLFDVVLFPLSFLLAFVLGWLAAPLWRPRRLRRNLEKSATFPIFRSEVVFKSTSLYHEGIFNEFKSTSIYKQYKAYFTVPYFIFLRDTLSFLALLGMHFAICVEPSQLSFSRLEWGILVFLFGRLLIEIKQIVDVARFEGKKMKRKALWSYLSDRWNFFDLAILFTFFCAIFPLRIVTWIKSDSVENNRTLEVAEYLYGFNTMLLTVRAFGSILEIFEGVGTIQIALFKIIRDAYVVVLHFLVITLAFSSTITKVFVAETSMVEGETGNYTLCNKPGLLCWKEIFIQLGLSLLQLSDGLAFFKSVDSISEILAYVLFAAYLVIALILLINMLIALLSNTYQRIQNNSQQEWAFQKAVTIQTYCNYHPIPVPFNIISTIALCCYGFRKKKPALTIGEANQKLRRATWLRIAIRFLQETYTLKYGDSFPPTFADKAIYELDKTTRGILTSTQNILENSESTECAINQLLYRAFTFQRGRDKAFLPTGHKAWKTHPDIIVESYLLTYQTSNHCTAGAIYRTSFSPSFPHFEVMILESGESKWLVLGVVFENNGTDKWPGVERGTVGYRTLDSRIFDAGRLSGKSTTGSTATRRGDVIRCTVMFGDKQDRDGKVLVPVVFSINGCTIVPEGEQTLIEYSTDRPLYPCITFVHKNSVFAKMCPREDVDYQNLQLQELKSDFAELKCELASISKHLRSAKEDEVGREVKAALADVREELHLQEVKSELESYLAEVRSDLAEVKSQLEIKMADVNRRLEEKLDAVLAKLH